MADPEPEDLQKVFQDSRNELIRIFNSNENLDLAKQKTIRTTLNHETLNQLRFNPKHRFSDYIKHDVIDLISPHKSIRLYRTLSKIIGQNAQDILMANNFLGTYRYYRYAPDKSQQESFKFIKGFIYIYSNGKRFYFGHISQDAIDKEIYEHPFCQTNENQTADFEHKGFVFFSNNRLSLVGYRPGVLRQIVIQTNTHTTVKTDILQGIVSSVSKGLNLFSTRFILIHKEHRYFNEPEKVESEFKSIVKSNAITASKYLYINCPVPEG
ncbi:MAG TPA: hypothetical protein ENJ30_02930 [Desulfobulbaceae bacterium]|nr:hypothetical protein [Desulfobulbaceae bacterium]